jgi:hypothetical protein
VLDKGAIAKFDTPWDLIREGRFKLYLGNMASSGMFTELERIVKDKAMDNA